MIISCVLQYFQFITLMYLHMLNFRRIFFLNSKLLQQHLKLSTTLILYVLWICSKHDMLILLFWYWPNRICTNHFIDRPNVFNWNRICKQNIPAWHRILWSFLAFQWNNLCKSALEYHRCKCHFSVQNWFIIILTKINENLCAYS